MIPAPQYHYENVKRKYIVKITYIPVVNTFVACTDRDIPFWPWWFLIVKVLNLRLMIILVILAWFIPLKHLKRVALFNQCRMVIHYSFISKEIINLNIIWVISKTFSLLKYTIFFVVVKDLYFDLFEITEINDIQYLFLFFVCWTKAFSSSMVNMLEYSHWLPFLTNPSRWELIVWASFISGKWLV